MSNIAKFYEKDGLVWFHLIVPSTACTNAAPFDFDGPATQSHVDDYPTEYQALVSEKRVTKEAEIALAVESALNPASPPEEPPVEGP